MTCSKVKFPDKKLAEIILQKLMKRKDRDERSIYYCEKCRCWHLTSQG